VGGFYSEGATVVAHRHIARPSEKRKGVRALDYLPGWERHPFRKRRRASGGDENECKARCASGNRHGVGFQHGALARPMRGTRMALEIPERFLSSSLSGFKMGTTTRGCVRSPCVVSKRTFADHYRLGGKICNETTSLYGVVFVSHS
jgi:hypothetical protein